MSLERHRFSHTVWEDILDRGKNMSRERMKREYMQDSNLANILSTNLLATELTWSTFDTGYQQKVFLRDKEHKLNENHL